MTGVIGVGWYISKLEGEYGILELPAPRKRARVLETLVLTVLSQNTNDVNRDRAYQSLLDKFPKWSELMNAQVSSISRAIKVGGLANQKAARIKEILSIVYEQQGCLDMQYLCKKPQHEAHAELIAFKGVGRKTAAVTLLFSCGMPVFPVDTHIHRVSGRLGLIGQDVNADKAHTILGRMVPDGKMYEFHINLIEHGRKVCHAGKPNCSACCLRSKCRYYQKNS